MSRLWRAVVYVCEGKDVRKHVDTVGQEPATIRTDTGSSLYKAGEEEQDFSPPPATKL